jgi:hypothetical protein
MFSLLRSAIKNLNNFYDINKYELSSGLGLIFLEQFLFQ